MKMLSAPVGNLKKIFYFTDNNRGKGFICTGKLGCQAAVVQTKADRSERLFTKRPCNNIIFCEMKCKAINSDNLNTNDSKSDYSEGLFAMIIKYLKAFYQFCRPHTIFGTVIGITSVSLLPVKSITDISPMFFKGLLKALIPAIFMNIYVVGLNQIFDIEIDKVNKPNLPLASGDFNMMVGIIVVISFLFMSFSMGIKSQSPPLLAALIISFLLGSAYSINLPLLRWKKHAFLAALCILSVRAILVQLAFFAHIQVYVLERPLSFTTSVIFATAFMCFFSAVIALFKDIPDVNGDKDFGIQSFSVRLGQKRVFWLCIKLLLIAYGFAIIVGVLSTKLHLRLVNVIGHVILASILWLRARCLDVQNKASVISFYMFIWKLFYAEYILIPFMH